MQPSEISTDQNQIKSNTLMDAVAAALFIFQEWGICYANPAFERLTGYTKKELCSLDLQTMFKQPNLQELATFILSSSPKQQLKILNGAGEECWVEITVVETEFNHQPALMGTLFDITPYKRTEEQLRSSEERFREVVHSISDHIYVTQVTADQRKINLYLSHHIEDLTGYPIDKFRHDWSFWPSAVIHPLDRTIAAAQAAQLMAGYDTETEYRLVRADGKIIWVRDSGRVQHQERTKIVYGVVSDITERKRLEDRLQAIYQFGQELNLLRDEQVIFERVLETTARILNADHVNYGLTDEQSDELTRCYQRIEGKIKKIYADQSRLYEIGQEVVQQKQAIHLEDISTTSDQTSRSQLCVPMKVGQRVIGVLNIESRSPHHFTANDQQLLQTLADQTAISIENARLHNDSRYKIEELATMNMISHALTSILNLGDTLSIIADHAIRLLDARAASLILHDPDKGDLWFDAAAGEMAHFVQGKHLPANEGIVGWVIQHGEPALVSNVAEDSRFFKVFDQESGFTTQSILCVPLQRRSQTIGAIEVVNKRKGLFNEKDLRLLSWLAVPAAIAIENARLYEAQQIAREQADTLREATSTLTSTLNLKQVLDSILIHLKQVIPYNNAYVFLCEKQWLQMVAGHGDAISEKRLIADDPLYQEIQKTRRPLILSEAESQKLGQKVRSWMGVPLMVRDEVIGYLTLESRQPKAYGPTGAKLAQTFADQAAIAIHNAQLFEQVQEGHHQLQYLSHRLVQIQETERRRVARELHDEAGQALTSLRVGLHLLEQAADDPKAVTARAAKLKEMISEVSDNLHRLAMDLRPASLDHLGLIPSLEQLVEMFNMQHDLVVQFETIGLKDHRLSSITETNLYRIVQEALTNVARHAQASRADIFMRRRKDQIIILIEDDGVGFDPESQSGRLGLIGMRERAEMLGGLLTVESASDGGTTIYVEVPYDHSNSDR